MPGFVFLSRKVELLGVKIIFLRNVLPVLNFSKDETFLKENLSNRQRKKYTVNTIPFQIYSIVFSPCINWRLRCSVLLPFFFKRREKKVSFLQSVLFCNQSRKIHSIPFLLFSRDHLRWTLGITCGRGSFAVHFGDHLRSRDHLRLGIICGTVHHSNMLWSRVFFLFWVTNWNYYFHYGVLKSYHTVVNMILCNIY